MTIRILDILPGVFTVGNLLCGFLSVRYSLMGEPVYAAWLIILASFFDALDGKLAKFAKSMLKFGVEFDSLADLVSFGLAPVILVCPLFSGSANRWAPALGFVFLLCGSVRLARLRQLPKGISSSGVTRSQSIRRRTRPRRPSGLLIRTGRKVDRPARRS